MSDKKNEVMIPSLKQDAIIELKFGTEIIQKLQFTLTYLTEGNEDKLKEIVDNVNTVNQNEPNWSNSVITILRILQEVMQVAEKTNQLEYSALEDSI